MSLTTSEMTPADFAAVTGNNRGGGGFGDGNGAWWIVLFLIFAMAGWGNGFGGGNGGGGGMTTPYVVDNTVQRGFDQSAIMTGIGNVQNGVQGLSTQLCNCCCDMQNTVNQGFFGVQNALCNGFNNVESSANARQMADMNQNFALQTAMSQGFNSLGSQFADCCCENRLATADLKYTIATENCADKLCQLELDAKDDKINDLERQLTMANLAASQIAQTAEIQRGQVGEVDALYNRLRDCPVPTMPVYGSQPIFTCPTTNNCGCNSGCGCGNF